MDDLFYYHFELKKIHYWPQFFMTSLHIMHTYLFYQLFWNYNVKSINATLFCNLLLNIVLILHWLYFCYPGWCKSYSLKSTLIVDSIIAGIPERLLVPEISILHFSIPFWNVKFDMLFLFDYHFTCNSFIMMVLCWYFIIIM